MMTPEYKRISCHLYDELELIAFRKKPIQIVYVFDGHRKNIYDTISTLKVHDGAEWACFQRNEPIRLDSLVEVDGITFL